MRVYILDLEYDPSLNSGRKWHEMLPEPISVTFDDLARASEVVDRATGQNVRIADGIRDLMVVHRSSVASNEDRVSAINDTGVPLLVVSRERHTEQVSGLGKISEAFYYRKAGILTRSEGVDTTFHDLFADFWKKYQDTGELGWAMLEPEPWPKSLVAVYLVVKSAQLSQQAGRYRILAAWEGMDQKAKHRIWRKARDEFGQQGGSSEKWRTAGLPDVSNGGDGQSLEVNEQQVAGAVDTIQSVFTR